MAALLSASFPVTQDSPAHAAGGLAASWALIDEAGEALAKLAELSCESSTLSPRDFAMRAAAAGPAQVALAQQAIDDCAAALHIGLTAIMASSQAGCDTTASALTLWREFDQARTGLLALTVLAH